ncbi:Porin subfamily protein [Pirellulimonas nuda]|uniref:Porin subfamily protein n=1 Tax=Pirellulimonas nuda TaxID=2528009 RepID=A0A518DFU3_9BACT|nr:DcaP family trimeric outer membrane transporter [Pirellulimonas nuda]QDU90350.1 Porin subfamily protein [Pirellulimonas nuda]
MQAVDRASTICLFLLATLLSPAAGAAQPPEPSSSALSGPPLAYPSTSEPSASQPSVGPAAPPVTDDVGYQYGYLDEQNIPGALRDDPLAEDLPAYYYSPRPYRATGLGVRPIADYAPPGYQPREQQEGPAVPEYSRLAPPVPISTEQRDSLVVRGIYPGSFLAPGTNTSFRLRGFVRLGALLDLDPIGSADSFVTNTIPVPQSAGQNFNMGGRFSRLGFETWTPTEFCDWNVHTFIEGDFFNGPAQAAGGGGNPFRLRNAFIDFGYFRLGQQNSVFMDGTNWPSVADFQGPNSWVNQRQPSARVTLPVCDCFYWAGAMERPFSDITFSPAQGAAVQDVPDFTTHLRYEATRGHAQLSALVRGIGYRPVDDAVARQAAAGVSGSAVLHPWAILFGTDPVHDPDPSGLTRSRMLMQATWGPGVGRYLNDLAGQGLDAQVDPVTGQLELVQATGWNASYEHWYNAHWLSNFTYSNVDVQNNAPTPAGTYASAQYVAAGLWWVPIPRLAIATEFLWGERQNEDGQSADVQRLHGMVQYNF